MDTLSKKYGIKDAGPLHFMLGVKISQKDKQVELCQSAYIDRILERFDMTECKGASTPFPSGRAMIGSIAYVMTCTRPDLAYAVSKLSRYLNDPKISHWKAAKYVLRYLKATWRMS
mmetsp:Transcript_23981/g.35950  ORF Transcript_23981/g.35950 Transcript_23981/m.35950 type:complete len:116 (+) Transcript_23981:1563-1910(+)